MAQSTVFPLLIEYDTANEARDASPRAIVTAKTKGGKFIPFDTYEAYAKWKETQ